MGQLKEKTRNEIESEKVSVKKQVETLRSLNQALNV